MHRLNHLPLPGGGVGGCLEHEDDTQSPFPGSNGGLLGADLLGGGGGPHNNNLDPEAPANYSYGRRRSRAVLYQLSGHYTSTEKTKKMHSKLSTNVSLHTRS